MPTGITKNLLDGLNERSMPVAEFSKVAAREGIPNASKTKLNEYFRDASPMPGDTAEKLWALWSEIELVQFQSYVLTGLPIRLNFSDGVKVHELLTMWRERMKQELEKNSNDSNETIPAAQ